MNEQEDRSYDQWLGGQVRLYRKLAGITQKALGASVGVTFQQIQKYENGKNRISVNALVRIAESLNTPISQLLDLSQCDKHNKNTGKLAKNSNYPITADKLHLLKHYSAIENAEVKHIVGQLVKVLGTTLSDLD